MGNVRRARHEQPAADDKPMAATANLSQDQIQQVIRQNLPGVKACYLRISRDGEQRSGKAIVSFDVGPEGDVRDTKVDAPSFQGTSLPTCVSGMVSHWAFPKSQSGGLAISYPFVFVGG
jgi:ribonuclease I